MSSNSQTFSSQNDTVNIKLANRGKDGDGSSNNIYLPDDNYGYGKHNDNEAQYLVTSNNQPDKLSSTEQANLVLKYIRQQDDKGEISGKINWVKDLETLGDFPNKISDVISRTLPIGDFFTDIQTNVDNFNSSTNNPIDSDIESDTKYKWVNLSGTIIDIGLHQLTWNTNKQYYYNEKTGNSVLNIECSNEIDESLGLKINYIVKSENKFEELTKYFDSISKYNNNKISCFKVNSVELIPTGDRTYNVDDIEFYFKPGGQLNLARDLSENFKNGVSKLTFHNPLDENSCFSYNCDYLNCQYYNMYYNKNRGLRLARELQEINTEEFTEVNLSFITDHVIEGDYSHGTIYELEGGRGRKAEITIKNASNENNENVLIKITNSGYLYQNGDLLRIKDRVLKNIIYFTVTNTDSDNITLNTETKFTQEYIKSNHGKSNTVKYCLDSNNCLLLKELNISGSTNSKILVRLIEVSKPLKHTNISNTNLSSDINTDRSIQKVIREFYYFNRGNIADVHHINTLIKPESEIFVDVQKLLENDDSDDKIDTLTFTINGIKIKIEEDTSDITSGFIMQRTV